MIHQVFLDALNHKHFELFNVNLLIIDECHHAIGNATYVQIFKGHYHPLAVRVVFLFTLQVILSQQWQVHSSFTQIINLFNIQTIIFF